MKTEKEKLEQEIQTALSEIINWWEIWKNSDDPTEMEDPPIEYAKKLLAKAR